MCHSKIYVLSPSFNVDCMWKCIVIHVVVSILADRGSSIITLAGQYESQ